MDLNCRTALLIVQVARNWRLMFEIYKILKVRPAINFAAKKLLHILFFFCDIYSRKFSNEKSPAPCQHLGKKFMGKMCSIYQVLWLHFELSATHSLLLSFSVSFCPKFAWYANLFRFVFCFVFQHIFLCKFYCSANTKLNWTLWNVLTISAIKYLSCGPLCGSLGTSMGQLYTTLLADAEPRDQDRVGSKTLWRLPAR